jgi:hypothetical protein
MIFLARLGNLISTFEIYILLFAGVLYRVRPCAPSFPFAENSIFLLSVWKFPLHLLASQ